MKKPTWEHLDDEEIEDEINLSHLGIERILESTYSAHTKERVINEYLEKLKTLYDEQRKRGTFKES